MKLQRNLPEKVMVTLNLPWVKLLQMNLHHYKNVMKNY